jgi:hypothetical protein
LEELGSARYQLQLDGFELGNSTDSFASFTKKRRKGPYEVDSIEKLHQKDYNLFSELTGGFGSDPTFVNPFSYIGGSNGNRNLKAFESQFPKEIENSVKKGKKAKFFKEFINQHKNTIETQITVIAEVFGQDSPLV